MSEPPTVRRGSAFVLAVLLAGTAPAQVDAQTVRVHLVEATTGRDVPGAILSLVSSADSIILQALSSESGIALLRAPHPGRYTVRVSRIGHRGATSAAVTFRAPGEHQSLTIRMPDRPTVLPELTTTARTQCALIGRADASVASLWDEARKGLLTRVLSDNAALPGFRLITYRRRLAPGLTVLTEDADTLPAFHAARPFVAAATANPNTNGYVQGSGPEFTFFGPDEALILSDEFLSTHCFVAVERTDGGIRRNGLHFRPIPGRRAPDITGTLWLGPAAAGLAMIEFTFVNVPAGVLTNGLEGRIDIERHPSGVSFVRRWYIRIPFPRRQAADDAVRGVRVTALGGFTEDGGIAERLAPPS